MPVFSRNLIISGFGIGILLCHFTASPAQSWEGRYRYMTPDRTSVAIIDHGNWVFGPITSLAAAHGKSPPLAEFLGDDVSDCSDEKYVCLTAGVITAAVPRAPFSASTRYVLMGNEFSVVECIREEEGGCQAALLKVYCHAIRTGSDHRTCVPRTVEMMPRDIQNGSVFYFIYNRDYGITSFGLDAEPVDGPRHTVADARFIARQYVLQGDVGLLKQ